MRTKTIRGMGASEGIAIGPVFRYEAPHLVVDQRHVDDVQHDSEIRTLDKAGDTPLQ